MADIHLTAGDDTYIQPAADANAGNNVFGEAGNDTIRMFQGTAIGGPGNDRVEKLADPSNPNRELGVAYWNAGENLRVNLAEGWAEDGQGGRDTLIGVSSVHGSGARNAWVQGDALNNTYWPNGGDDTFLGGGGTDVIYINGGSQDPATNTWREALVGELIIDVSADGRSASFRPSFGNGYSYVVQDVEQFYARWKLNDDNDEWGWRLYQVADFITPQSMAENAIAAGGDLRWNASQPVGTRVDVTFSFVTSSTQSGFRAFTRGRAARWCATSWPTPRHCSR
jgi:hypothetical protein